jgi:hypothetical protein
MFVWYPSLNELDAAPGARTTVLCCGAWAFELGLQSYAIFWEPKIFGRGDFRWTRPELSDHPNIPAGHFLYMKN